MHPSQTHAHSSLQRALHAVAEKLVIDPELGRQVRDTIDLVGPSGSAVWEEATTHLASLCGEKLLSEHGQELKIDPYHGDLGRQRLLGLIQEADDLLRFANAMIHARPYHTVQHHHRVLYQVAAIAVACSHVAIATAPPSSNASDSDHGMGLAMSQSGPGETVALEKHLAKALHALDEAMIVTGFPVVRQQLMDIVYQLHGLLPQPAPLFPSDHSKPVAQAVPISPVPQSPPFPSTHDSLPSQIGGIHRFPYVREIDLDHSFSPGFYSDMIDTPFIIRNAIQHWPALDLWTLDYLNQTAGHRLVPVELGSTYLDSAWSQQLMTLNRFLRDHVIPFDSASASSLALSEDGNGKPATIGYLAQYNLFALLPHLRSHISLPDQIDVLVAATTSESDATMRAPPQTKKRRTHASTQSLSTPEPHGSDTSAHHHDRGDAIRINAWLGPRGTVTPLHHDGSLKNMFAQVVGSKRVVLFPPADSSLLADLDGMLHNTSSVDVLNWTQEVEARPELHQTCGMEAVCGPGDLLYIPAKYWHYVESLSTSFSVSFWF